MPDKTHTQYIYRYVRPTHRQTFLLKIPVCIVLSIFYWAVGEVIAGGVLTRRSLRQSCIYIHSHALCMLPRGFKKSCRKPVYNPFKRSGMSISLFPKLLIFFNTLFMGGGIRKSPPPYFWGKLLIFSKIITANLFVMRYN